MIKQQRLKKFLNILICFMLLVCCLNHEPFVMPLSSSDSSISALKSCHYSSSTIKAQTEIIGEKAEQLSVKSINKSTTHRSYRKNGFRNNSIPVNTVKSIPNRILTTAESIHIYLGANTSFKCMLSYIWSHVDL